MMNQINGSTTRDASFIMDKIATLVAKKLKITNWSSWWQNEQPIDFNSMGYVLTIEDTIDIDLNNLIYFRN
jgi:hypothetical protein